MPMHGIDQYSREVLVQWQKATIWTMDRLPQFINTLINPRQLVRHLVMIIGLQSFVVGWKFSSYYFSKFWSRYLSRNGKLIHDIEYAMNHECETYNQWKKYASKLDKLRGHDKWRNNDICPMFDHRIIRKKIAEITDMIENGDMFNLMFRIRGGLARDQYGTLNKELYDVAQAGTKRIVEDFHDTISRALNFICDTEDPDVRDVIKRLN